MATNVKKGLDEMEKEITCGVCQELYTDPEQTPKVLPCFHYYCKKCILVLASKASRPLLCPECRRTIVLPEGGVNELTTAYFVYRLKSIFEIMQKARGKAEVWCEACESGAKAEAFCRKCKLFICEECVHSHQKMKNVFEGHEVTAIADLQDSKPPVADAPPKECDLHEQPLCFYCFDCGGLICQYCTAKLHRDHNFEFCKVAAASKKKALHAKAELLRENSAIKDAIRGVQTRLDEMEACGASMVDEILQSFKELQSIIDARKEDLILNANMCIQRKLETLSQQKKQLIFSGEKVQDVISYAQRCLEHCTDNEVMEMHAEVIRRVEAEEEECGKLRDVTPVEEVDVGVNVMVADALKEICQTNAAVITLSIDPGKCTVDAMLPDSVEVDEPAEVNFTLHAVLTNGVPSDRAACEISCNLVSLCDGSIGQCEVVCNKQRKYFVRFLPTVRGRHKLVVVVNGTAIGESIPVFVSIHPKKLGKPVKPAWTGIPRPSGIAINSVGDIVVMEFKGGIFVHSRDSAYVKCFSQHQLTHPYAVAVDDEDSVYCTDMSTNKVFKSDKNGKTVKCIPIEGAGGQFGIAFMEGKIIIGRNKGRHRSFAVLNKDMDILEEVDCENEEVKSLYHMSPDRHGNLYAVDHNAAVIHKFSSENLSLLSTIRNLDNVLVGPVGVSVFGSYVYVAEFKQHSIRVYSTEGILVHTIGKLGSLEGEFRHPFGICLDQDGFLYVSDMHNNRIQIF